MGTKAAASPNRGPAGQPAPLLSQPLPGSHPWLQSVASISTWRLSLRRRRDGLEI